MSGIDFDSEDHEFRRELAPMLSANCAAAGPCPEPRLLLAVRSGVAVESAAAVERHVTLCPMCQQLSRDLADHEFPAASEAEDRRIRARWQGASRHGFRSREWMVPLVAACAVLVIAIVLVRDRHRGPAAPEPVAQSSAPARPETGPFTLTKAAIKVPAAAVLTFRGSGGGAQNYLADLAAALEPYRKDDFAEAARRLGLLASRYPEAAEPPFYEGVSQLYLNQNEAAVQSLESARRRGTDTLKDDISWYLGLAYHRVGRIPDAHRELDGLCKYSGQYQNGACAALKALQ